MSRNTYIRNLLLGASPGVPAHQYCGPFVRNRSGVQSARVVPRDMSVESQRAVPISITYQTADLGAQPKGGHTDNPQEVVALFGQPGPFGTFCTLTETDVRQLLDCIQNFVAHVVVMTANVFSSWQCSQGIENRQATTAYRTQLS